MIRFLASRSITLLAVILAVSLHAQTPDSSPKWFEKTGNNAWLQPYDTTLISRRVFAEFSYENHDNEDFWKIENSLRRGFAIHDDLAFGLQLMVPVKWIDSATSNASGLGDLELRSGFIGRLSPTLRWGAGLNAAFDTASDSAIGSNALIFRPIFALRWDANDWINLGINVEYNITPQEEQSDDVSTIELKFPLVFKLSDQWSAASSYKLRRNFLDESNRHRIELGANRLFGIEKQFALSFSLEVPLASESLNYKLVSGLAWSF